MLKKPKQTKYSKYHKGRISYNFRFHSYKKLNHHTTLPSKSHKSFSSVKSSFFKSFSLVALEPARLTASQIAAAELAIKRKIRKEGFLHTPVFPHFPVTNKPLEVRMGKGKGSTSYWMTRVQPGSYIFELKGKNEELAKIAFKIASSKLPLRTVVI